MLINNYSLAFKISYLTVIIPTILVVVAAFVSSREIGGTLGQGIKKIAAGSVVDTILIATYIVLEGGNKGLLSDNAVQLFFLTAGMFGSLLLILGYVQIYKIAKRLKLFT